MLIDIRFPHVSIWVFIRVKKHLVNNLHLKLPWSSTLTGCRQSDREGLAELNRGSGLAICFQSRVAQRGRNFRTVKPALKIYYRKVSGTWHGVDADFFFSLAPQEGVSSGFSAHLVAFLRVGFCRGFVLGEMNPDKSA